MMFRGVLFLLEYDLCRSAADRRLGVFQMVA